MWFKNLIIYRLPELWPDDKTKLQAALDGAAFAPCTGLDWFSEGFAAPMPFEPDLVFAAGRSQRVALKREDKVLPGAVVRDLLAEKVAAIEAAEARNVGRKEKQELKWQIIDDLLPRAFTKSRRTEALFDTRSGYLMINEASAPRAERMLTKLREALGGLQTAMPHTLKPPTYLMTEWLLQGRAEGGFKLGYSALLKGVGDVPDKIKIINKHLDDAEVVQHVKNGMRVVELELNWREQISFTLTHDFALKRIVFLDRVQEQAEQGDDAASLATASQILMTAALGDMLDEFYHLLSGWVD